MLRRTPLKRNTPLRAKAPLRAKTELKAKSELKAKTPLKAAADKPKKAVIVKTKATKHTREPNYVKDMDRVFQYWVRLRDVRPGGFGTCISCGKPKPFDHLQGGHFWSRKHMSTRWHPDNVNAECEYCNCWEGNHLLFYKENLIRKIGLQRYQNLEKLHNQQKKWSSFEIKRMIKYYGHQILQQASAKHLPISKEVQAIIRRYQKMKL